MVENQSYQISLKLILRNNFGQVLVLRLPHDSIIESMRREIKEELGDDVKWELTSAKPAGISLHHYFSKRHEKEIYVIWLLFDALYLGGEFNLSDEHAGFEWIKFNKSNIKKYFVSGHLEAANNYLGL